ncbi:MAG: DUF4926 domain-containing protein [Hyphomicrobium aestuarii]|nr:DUF4926 domain-containing protein [Hyphomicrobium aestuarii]
MLKELDTVVLVRDIPEAHLAAGDIGAIVHADADVSAYEVEFVALTGETVALLTLTADDIRSIGTGEIANARKVA